LNTLTKYWFLEGFNHFNKLGRLNMMRTCAILEMDNFNKGAIISDKDENEKSVFF
jgi:CRP/FNR family transcriptional regulator